MAYSISPTTLSHLFGIVSNLYCLYAGLPAALQPPTVILLDFQA